MMFYYDRPILQKFKATHDLTYANYSVVYYLFSEIDQRKSGSTQQKNRRLQWANALKIQSGTFSVSVGSSKSKYRTV